MPGSETGARSQEWDGSGCPGQARLGHRGRSGRGEPGPDGGRGLLGVGEPVLARSGHGAFQHHQRHRHYRGARLRGGTVVGCRRVPARGGLSASNA